MLEDGMGAAGAGDEGTRGAGGGDGSRMVADGPKRACRAVAAPSRAVNVRVPATSANLGPGFDTLGMALSLYNEFTFEPADELSFEGCEERFANPSHLAWVTYEKVLWSLGMKAAPVRIVQHDGVPLAGGLGSSSTCIVAGIAAALTVASEPLDRHRILELAAAAEGHPDNVAPAVLGGVVSAFVTRENEVIADKRTVDGRWRFMAVCPPYEVRTADARRVMPESVGLSDVVWQLGRCGAVARALETGDGPLLRKACDDHLHEPYRKELIPDYEGCRKSALASGASAFWISGSGSTMMAACLGDEAAFHVAAAMPESCTVLLLSADNDGVVLS